MDSVDKHGAAASNTDSVDIHTRDNPKRDPSADSKRAQILGHTGHPRFGEPSAVFGSNCHLDGFTGYRRFGRRRQLIISGSLMRTS